MWICGRRRVAWGISRLCSWMPSGEALKNDIRAQDTRALDTMTKGQPGKKVNRLEITTLDPSALAEWRKQTEAVYPKMKGKMVPADLFDEVQRLRDEYRVQHPLATPEKAGTKSMPKGKAK